MNPGIMDHLIAFILVVVLPIMARWSYPRIAAKIRSDPSARRREYKWVIAQQWLLVAAVLGVWFALGREPAAIGLAVPPGLRTLVGVGITAALVTAMYVQFATLRRGGEAARVALRAQIHSVQDLMPRTASEARWFRVLAVTAGICEEVMYRGFLIAYLAAFVGTWPAVAVGAAAFGIAHIYQGRTNAFMAFVLSLLVGVLYVACGSLLWPMILHAAQDLYGGAMARYALGDDPQP